MRSKILLLTMLLLATTLSLKLPKNAHLRINHLTESNLSPSEQPNIADETPSTNDQQKSSSGGVQNGYKFAALC